SRRPRTGAGTTSSTSTRSGTAPSSTSLPGCDDKNDYEKILVEQVVTGDTGLPATVLRLPMVYGPGDEQHRLAPYLKRMMDGGEVILLDEGMARWRCLRGYVEEVAAAIALAVTSPAAAGRVYNVAEPTAHTEAGALLIGAAIDDTFGNLADLVKW